MPPDGARRFREALAHTYAACQERLVVIEYDDVRHTFTDTILQDALAWFVRHQSER